MTSATNLDETRESVSSAGPRRGRGRPVGVPVVVGSLCTLVTYWMLDSGRLPAPVALVPLALVLVLVPVADSLAKRVALNGAMLIGWAPLLWWVRWPVSFNHGAAIVGIALGAVIALPLASPQPRRAWQRLLPRTRPIELAIPVGGVLAFAVMQKWALARTPTRALTVLLPGADNYPHFNMFAGIRTRGATLDVLGLAPDKSRWAFFNYPQGFHALVASLSEIITPRVASGPQLLVAYTQAVAVLIVLVVVLLTSAITAFPPLRARPAVALPALVVTWAAFLWEPGQHVLVDGFANFWLGAAAAGMALLLGANAPRFMSTPEAVAMGGLFVACADTWTPLLLFALPGLLGLLVGLRDEGAREVRRRVALGLGVAAASICAVSATVLLLLHTVPVSYVVTTKTGGLHATSPLPTFALLILALYSCLSYSTVQRRRPDTSGANRLAARIKVLALAPLSGLLVLGAFLFAQLHLIGTTAYYFLKYLTGFELVMAVLAPVSFALVVAGYVPMLPRRRGAALATVAAILASQSFGRFPQGKMPLYSESDGGTAAVGAPLSRYGIATGVLSAVRGTSSADTFSVEYFPLGPARAYNPFYADAWFHAVQQTLSLTVFERYAPWRVKVESLDGAARLIETTLRENANVVVVVDPRYVQRLRERLGQGEFSGRLVAWDAGSP